MERKIVFYGRRIRVAVDTDEIEPGKTYQRDVVLHPGSVAILPIIDAQHICLLRNRRPVTGETLWEIPAGTLETNELPAHAAQRELEEESGYRTTNLKKVAEFYPSPGVSNELMHLFFAQDLTKGEMRPEVGEDLVPETIPGLEALNWTLSGRIRDAKTLFAILLWHRLNGS